MANIEGHGGPKSTTVGNLGDQYIDVDTGATYELIVIHRCTGKDGIDLSYDWVYKKSTGDNGSVDKSEIEQIVAEYLEANPPNASVSDLIVTTDGTGSEYTATVSGITELKEGTRFIMIPHVTSTSATATLNVNSLGAKQIRQQLSTNNTDTVVGGTDDWLHAGKPISIMYNGEFWVAEITRPAANNIYGTVPISSGGTGATTLEEVEDTLGINQLKQKVTTINLLASGWTGEGTTCSQTVSVSFVTANSQVELRPSPEQLQELLLAEITLTVANESGTVTVFAIGGVPASDYEMQIIISEVDNT